MEENDNVIKNFKGPSKDPSLVSMKNAKEISKFPHHGPIVTFTDFGNLGKGITIDYIFVKDGEKKFQVNQHATITDFYDNSCVEKFSRNSHNLLGIHLVTTDLL